MSSESEAESKNMKGVDMTPSKLRIWREMHGFRLADVAGLSGLSEPTLSLVETGQRRLSAKTKVHLARTLGAKVKDLFEPDPLPTEEQDSQLCVR
jgi:transcriptional regulator with XRE-family HTH domain